MFNISCVQLPSKDLFYTNKVYVAQQHYQQIRQSYRSEPIYVEVNGFTFTLDTHPSMGDGLGMSKAFREVARVSLSTPVSVKLFRLPEGFDIRTVSMEIDLFGGRPGKKFTYKEEDMARHLKSLYAGLILTQGLVLVFDYEGIPMSATVLAVFQGEKGTPPASTSSGPSRGLLTAASALDLSGTPGGSVTIESTRAKRVNLFNGTAFNFEEMGIGGLDKEFELIFRQTFASRLISAKKMNALGLHHVKGILLHGPPGTGKTLIARQIAKCLHVAEPKVVNGPEVFSKFVGETESNVRDLFKEAEDDQAQNGDDSKLHIIIFDEFDAICRPRGTLSNSTGVHDTVVNQLLSKIDGVHSLNNILIIGMTNRKDMIDEAVLRQGRLEMHVEIGLPDEFGRVQILNIHTSKMRACGALGQDVDIPGLAVKTKNYTGAEIEALVRRAASFAFRREIDPHNLDKEPDEDNIRVMMEDFTQGLREIKPMHGIDEDDLHHYIRGGLIDYGPVFRDLMGTCRAMVQQVKTSQETPLLSILLHGESGTGKTAIAAQLAVESEFPFIKIISPENYIGYTENGKIAAISKVFEDAYRTPLSFVVLDNIERLIEYIPSGPRFSNPILQALLILAKRLPPNEDRRIVVIGTTSEERMLDDLHIEQVFKEVIEVKALQTVSEVEAVLRSKGISQPELTRRIASESINIPIQKLLITLVRAMQSEEGLSIEAFQECLRPKTSRVPDRLYR